MGRDAAELGREAAGGSVDQRPERSQQAQAVRKQESWGREGEATRQRKEVESRGR